jgi:preprotein translocase subunit SecA
MNSLGMERGEAIEHRMVTNAIERAQRKVEGHNFDIRKNLLEYDDVSNDQRQVIYAQRDELMAAEDISETIAGMRAEVVDDVISEYLPPGSLEEQWDVEGLEQALIVEFDSQQPLRRWLEEDEQLDEERPARAHPRADRGRVRRQGGAGRQRGHAPAREAHDAAHARSALERAPAGHGPAAPGHPPARLRAEAAEAGVQARVLRAVPGAALTTSVATWFASSRAPSSARRTRPRSRSDSAARRPPDAWSCGIRRRVPSTLPTRTNCRWRRARTACRRAVRVRPRPRPSRETFVRDGRKVGRNEPCPCGSGKKYKHCHGRIS